MHTSDANDRWVTAASMATAVFAVALPASALLLWAPLLPDGKVTIGWVLIAAFVPLHLGHIRYGLRDQTPPRGGWTFAVMAAIMVTGEIVIGPLWTPQFASLAASALLVFRPPWSAAVALVIIASCLVLGDAPLGDGGAYTTVTVAFRSVTLFTLVWFVAGVRRLRRARGALADRAIEKERSRVDAALLGTLSVELARIEARAQAADAALAGGDAGVARAELERMTSGARETLATARSAVAGLRHGGSRAELLAAARLLAGPDRAEA